MPATSAPTSEPRWNDHTCSRCDATLTIGSTAYNLYAGEYRPMQPGPDWDAIGDWTTPNPLGPVLCSSCLEDVLTFAMARVLNKPSKP